MDDREITAASKGSQRGSVFTVLLAGIAIAGALSVVLYQTISGPMSSMVRVTNKTTALQTMHAIGTNLIRAAVTQPANGECDLTGGNQYVVPVAPLSAALAPSGGGQIPLTVGTSTTDPWGTPYGYCAWEVGLPNNKCTGSTLLYGTDDPSGTLRGATDTGNPNVSRIVIAVISAGPDRKFNTTCSNYAGGSSAPNPGNATGDKTPVVTQGGDDIVVQYTYGEAATATSSLWYLDKVNSNQADIGSKNINVGTAPTTPTVPTAASSAYATVASTYGSNNGIVNANAVVTQGSIIAGGAIQLADSAVTALTQNLTSTADGMCDESAGTGANVGAMRYNVAHNYAEVCECTGVWSPAPPSTTIASVCSKAKWTAVGSGGGVTLDAVKAAAADGTAQDSGNHPIIWNWSTLAAGASGLTVGTAGAVDNTALTATNATTSTDQFSVQGYSNAASSLSYSATTGVANGAGNGAAGIIGANTGTSNVGYGGFFANSNTAAGSNGAALGIAGFTTYLGLPTTKQPAVAAGSAATGTARLYFDTTAAALELSIDGGNYYPLLTSHSSLYIGNLGDAYTDYTNKNIILGSTAQNVPPTLSLSGTIAQYNTYLGLNAGNLTATNTGSNNSAIGYQAMVVNTTGSRDVAVGYQSLYANTIGNGNTAVGGQALYSNVAKGGNTAIGRAAMLYANSDSTSASTLNTAVGYQALEGSTTAASNTGVTNTAVGANAIQNITSGNNNSALGNSALLNTASGAANVGVGVGALLSNVAKNNNTAVGFDAMYYAYSDATAAAGNNTAVGYAALMGSSTAANNSGVGNTAVGVTAMQNITSGNSNVGVGFAALLNAANSNNNVGVGTNALYSNVAKSYNTAVGYNAMYYAYNDTTAANTFNTALGFDALEGSSTAANNSGVDNTAIGTYSIQNITSGNYNAALGYGALMNNAGGGSNVAIGMDSLQSNVAKSNNTAIGTFAMQYAYNDTTVVAGNNTALGYAALQGSTTPANNSGTNNVAIGVLAIQNITSGNGNVGVGYASLLNTANGGGNVGIGLNALQNNVAKSNNVAIGYNAMVYAYNDTALGATNNTAVGTAALQGSSTPANNSGFNNTAIGTSAILSITSGTGNAALGVSALQNNASGSSNVAVGASALFNNVAKGNNTAIGWNAMYYAYNDTTVAAGNNVAVGLQALEGSSTPANNSGAGNTAIGVNAIAGITSGNWNAALGEYALVGNASGTGNVGIGVNALYSNVAKGNNTAVGYNAMLYANNDTTVAASNNTAVGASALQGSATAANNSGIANTAVGVAAIQYITSGNYNAAFGNQSLANNANGSNNVGVGVNALNNNVAKNNNTAIGYDAMAYAYNDTTAANSNNTAVGYYTLAGSATPANNSGTNNAALGASALQADTSGGNNTALGYEAGYGTTGPGTYAVTTGSSDTFVGYNAAPGTATQLSNATAIGANATVTASNSLVLGSSANVGIGSSAPATLLTVAGPLSLQQPPAAKTANYTQTTSDSSLIFNGTSSITLTLLPAASYPGQMLNVMNTAAYTVVSASSNVIPQAGGLAGAAILPATAGSWATLQSNGTNWVIIHSGGSGGSVALSSITAGVATNTIDSTNYAQTWNWSALAGASALTLGTTSTAATSNAQTLLNISMSGANASSGQSTYGEQISNTHTGSGTNIGLYATASGGTNNYSAIFNSGSVGIGTTSPGGTPGGSTGNGNIALDVLGPARVSNNLDSVGNTLTLYNTNQAGGTQAYYFIQATGNSGTTPFSVDGRGDLVAAGMTTLGASAGAGNYTPYIAQVGGTLNNGGGDSYGLYVGPTGTANAYGHQQGAIYANMAGYTGSTSSYGVLSTNTSAGTGTNYGINATATGAGTTNVGGYFSASGGTNNYALITGTGNVGIGTSTPPNPLTVSGNTQLGSCANGECSVFIGSADKTASLDYGTAYIGFNMIQGASNSWTAYSDTANNGAGAIWISAGGDMFFAPVPISGSPTTSQTLTDANLVSDIKLWIAKNGYLGVNSSSTPTSVLTVAGPLSLQKPPAAKTANYTQTATDSSLIFSGTSSITLTLLPAATYPGQLLFLSNQAAYAVVSATSNVIPQAGGLAGTAILPATAGAWAELQSNGTNWVIMESGGGSTSSALSSLTAATATNSIDSGNYAQTWNWNSLAGASALTLSTTSTAAASNAQTLLNLSSSGANATTTQTTYGEQISNTHTGTSASNVGLSAAASGGTLNYAALFSSTYAAPVTTGYGDAVKITLTDSNNTSTSTSFTDGLEIQVNKTGTSNQSGYEQDGILIDGIVSGGTLANDWGIESRVQVATGGTVTAGYDFFAAGDLQTGGTMGTRDGLYVQDNGKPVTYQYGVNIAPLTSGSSYNFGLYVGTPSGATNNYAIYSNGGYNYFGGNVGIGTGTQATGSALTVYGNGSFGNIGAAPAIAYVGTAGEASGLNYADAYFGINAVRTGSNSWTLNTDTAHNGGSAIFSDVSGYMYFASIPSNAPSSAQTLTDAQVLADTKLEIFNGNVGIGLPGTAPGTLLTVAGPISLQEPSTTNITATTYTVATTDSSLIFAPTATTTVTLPTASMYPGRILWMNNTGAYTVVSATSNVIPQVGGSAAAGILPATPGAWAELQSNGANWVIMSSGGGGVLSINGLTDAMADYTNTNLVLGSSSATTKPVFGGGTHNTFVGTDAGNPVAGYNAGSNTVLGYAALSNDTSGANNTALGTAALQYVTGGGNIGVGYSALLYGSGSGNTAVGNSALAGASGSSGNYNTAVGAAALTSVTSGTDDAVLGYNALRQATTDGATVAIGFQALYSQNLAGATAGNVAVGYLAGYTGTALTTGYQDTFIGANAGIAASASQYTNSTALGYGAQVTASNQIQLGNSSVTAVNAGGAGTTLTVGATSTSSNIVAVAPTTGLAAPTSGYAGSVNVTTFTSTGTYTPPANLVYATVEVVGGGGGGGGTNWAGAAGGGGGGYARRTMNASTIGTSAITVTIGGGGGGGGACTCAGGTGGTTSFGALVVATGGSGGSGGGGGTGYPGGAGGTGTTGDLLITGQTGGEGFSSGNYWGGSGGNSIFGGGAPGQSNTGTGIAGSTYGGGGGGGAGNASGFSGGAGKSGVVIVTAYTY